jgi:hypothetical protein
MRLAFCFISNRPAYLYDLEKNFIYDINDPSNTCVSSFSMNILTNPPIPSLFVHPKWHTKWVNYNSNIAVDYFALRQDSFTMANNADIIYMGDDDMKFKKGSTEIINKCCQYMKNNPTCGIIFLGGKFGGEGALHNDEIFIANKGSMGTNRGILIRNRPIIMDNRLHALGSCEELAMGLTALMQGYYITRRLNISEIEHESKGRISEDNENINYNLSFLRTKGIRSKIDLVIGKCDNREEWPKDIWPLYRKACIINGNHPIYTYEGEIE